MASDRVTGQVFGNDGRELPGVDVEVWLPQPAGAPDKRAFRGTTDEHGAFAGDTDPGTSLGGANHIKVMAARFSHSWHGDFLPGGFQLQATMANSWTVDHQTLSVNIGVNWHMACNLPQNDPDLLRRAVRATNIGARAWAYPWSSALGIPLISCNAVIPPAERPREDFLVGYPGNPGFLLRTQRNSANTAATAHRHPDERLETFDDFRDQYDRGDGLANPPMPTPRIIADDYPSSTDGFPSDKSFAWQRIAGINPVVLRLVTEFPKDDFPIATADLRPYFRSFADLDRARQEKRLYIADYEFLGGVPERGAPRFLPAPFALFYYMGQRPKDAPLRPLGGALPGNLGQELEPHRAPRFEGQFQPPAGAVSIQSLYATPLTEGLAPVAIQIDRRFDPVSNPIWTPKDDDSRGKRWGLAKLMVQVADFNYHETKTHLAESHLLMEAFKVAMEHTLSEDHPLGVLLRHHFQGLIAINYLAFNTLIAPGGGVDELLGNNLSGSLFLAQRAASRWNYQKCSFRAELAGRGLLEGDTTIPFYPYRDDGLRVWGAIREFVRQFLLIYYVNDAAVVDDTELAAWMKDLADQGVAGLPAVAKWEVLLNFVTDLIFNSSARHAAVNFSQYDYAGFIPNMPGAAFTMPIDSAGQVIPNWMDVLPPARETRDMVELMSNLALYQYGQLGSYPTGLIDAEADEAASRFRDALHDVQNAIDHANLSRPYPYPYLLPMSVPNSTNV